VNAKLKAGETGWVGLTTGASPHAVYYVKNGANYDLEAVPAAGGAPVVLQASIADDDFAYVRGGAVAWYTGTSPTTGIATAINVWTKTTGKKAVNAATLDGFFTASEDGTAVAFSVNATANSTDFAVTTSAAPSALTPAITGANAVNLAAAGTCAPNVAFAPAGTTLIGTYCTGVEATATQPKLITVAAGGAAIVRIDNAGPTTAIQSTWFADKTGTKLFVIGTAPNNEGRIVIANGVDTTVAPVDTNQDGVATVAPDGAFAVYTAGGALKKATFAAVPVVTPVVATGVVSVLQFSTDSKRVLYTTQADAPNGLTDLKSVDVSAAVPAPVVLVATPTANVSGLTGSGTHVLYRDTIVQGKGKLSSIPVGGGAAKILDMASFAASPAREGTGVLTATAVADLDGKGALGVTFQYVDAVVGGALQAGASDVLLLTGNEAAPSGGWAGKTYVHTNIGQAAPGIYGLKVP